MFTKLALSCCAVVLSYCAASAQTTSKVTPEDIKSGKYSIDLEKLKEEQAKAYPLIATTNPQNCSKSNITPAQQSEKLAVTIQEVTAVLENMKAAGKDDALNMKKYEETLATLKAQKATLDNQISKQ